MSTSTQYSVIVWDYAQRHFCKDFAKKYKTARDKTMKSIQQTLVRIDKADLIWWLSVIHAGDSWVIYKYEFKILWDNRSARDSWNRCIVYHHYETNEVMLLLVYHKWHIGWGNETVRREQQIKKNYDVIKDWFLYL